MSFSVNHLVRVDELKCLVLMAHTPPEAQLRLLVGGVATQQQKSAELANTEFINQGPKAKE